MPTIELDYVDKIAAQAFDGYIVRKDLVRKFARQYPVPTYVCEFLLGRYCASIDEAEIQEGLSIVERQLHERAVRSGEEELFKSRARERGSVKVIDLITARLDAKTDSYVATLPSLQLKDVCIDDQLVKENERMLTGGFYAEVDLAYDAIIAQETNGRPFSIAALRPIQLSKRNVLDALHEGRAKFTTEEWKGFLLRSIGLEPTQMTERNRDVLILRMVPFVENNDNLVELGPRGTGKSHLFQQISPYAHLISGGKATVARMFVNMATGQRGLVCQYDVVCFDEISGISFDQKDRVNIMKGYMESGEFSRGKESIRAYGGLVMVGNFEVDVEHQQRIGHLLGPMPPEMRDDTAFMDRIHLTLAEAREILVSKSQIATLKRGQNIKYAPFVFTEHGAVMLASVLNSPVAIQASIAVVEAFIRLRQMLTSHVELARKLEALEKKYDAQFKVVFDAIRELMKPPEPKRQRIGFHAPSKKNPTST